MNPTTWTKWHTAAVLIVVALILALGSASTWISFEKESNWGVWAFIILAALLVGLLGVIGHGLVGRVDGALMDNRFRISLAQFQIAVWTVLVLGAWAAAVFANLGLTESTNAFDVSIPSELWLALGISATSFGGAKLIQAKDARKAPLSIPEQSATGQTLIQRGQSPAAWTVRGNLLAHRIPADATWGDLFAADGTDDGGVPDISKIQMFFFTVVLAFGYAVASIDLFASHGSDPITGLPPLNESFVILLGISQGSYLVKKGVDLRLNA
jgi:hypothetical protein